MKNIDKRLDDAWSELIKLKADYKCEYCGKSTQLNSHHIFSRAKRSTRWDTTNGICLCVAHHIGNEFSAHKTPLSFSLWLISQRGEEWYNILNIRSNQISKLHAFEKELLLKELQKEINNYK